MKNFKKLISVILAVMMVMSVMPVGAAGTDGAGGGSSASSYPAGATGLFYEDFDSGYVVGEEWVNDTNKAKAATDSFSSKDYISYRTADGKWDIQSNLYNGATANTGDSVKVVSVSGLNLGEGFSGNALRLYNNRATRYDRNFVSVRRNFDNPISLTSIENKGKKLVYEADVKLGYIGTTNISNSSDHLNSFFVPSRTTQIYEYNGTFKASLGRTGKFRIEQGGWADKNAGANYMWYTVPASADNFLTSGKLKVVIDQTGKVDTMSAYVNGTILQNTAASVFNDHPMSGTVATEFGHSGFQGQEFNFADTIYGIWGNATDMEIYIDNFKAYLIDEFEVAQVNAKATGFDPSVDTVEFTFTNEIDETTVSNDAAVLLKADGTEVTDGIVSVAVKSGDAKTLQVKITETVLGNTTYKVQLKDTLKDIYGFGYEREYVWYEYPMTQKYTLSNNAGKYTVNGTNYDFTYTPKTATEGAKVTAGGKTAFIDCYIPQMKQANTVATFETCTLLEYESATPANEAITAYVQGEDQEIVLQFNDELADTVDIANAFEVKDEDGTTVTGLVAEFGATKDIVKLQLSGLTLGNGKHTISSKANKLFNANNKYANIEYTFDTLDFTATPSENDFDYMPKDAKTVDVTLSIPTTLTNENILTGFEVVDGEGNPVTGLAATLSGDKKIVTLSLAGLDVEKGTVVIKPTAALTDNRGRTTDFEIAFDIIEFTATASESSGFQLKPGENKEVTITLSLPTTLAAADILTGFEVVNQNGSKVNGLGAVLGGDSKTVTLQLKNLVVENGKYYIKSTPALADAIGRQAEVNLMFNVAKEVILFEEDFEFGYPLNENWINDDNKVDTGKYKVANGAWEIQTNGTPTTDSMSVVDVSGLNLDGNFSGKALRIYNDRATAIATGYTAFRRNFDQAISLTDGEYAGKKLVYEADVVVKKIGTNISSSNYASPLFEPSKDLITIFEYSNDTYKPSITSNGAFRIEQGSYASASYGPMYMWYYTPATASLKDNAVKIKMVFNQNGTVDTLRFYADGTLVTTTANTVLNGHKLNGSTITDFGPANFQGQEYDFGSTLYGIWGSAVDCEYYIDNFKAYLIDSFSIASVAVDGSTTNYEASTDSVVYKFTGEVDPATIQNCVTVYDAAGEPVNAVKSLTLEDGNKTLRVVLQKSIAGESQYTVKLNDAIKDIYGAGIANDYEWYEYPINNYYTATNGTYMIGSAECRYIPAANGVGAKMELTSGSNLRTAFVDCYVPVPSTANREVTFTTSRKIVVTDVTPSVIPGYDLGRDQEITITLAEELNPAINLNEAFTVTDADGKNITGLAAAFGDTTNVIKLQLSGLQLGDGKHFIESVDGALVNADGIFANVSIAVSTVDFMVTYAEPGSEVLTEYKEGDNQEIVIGLSSPSVLPSAEFATAFEVVDEDGTPVPGLKATYNSNNPERSDDDTIVIQLSGLVLGRGKHTIKATDKLVDRRGRTLEYEYTFTKLPFKADYVATLSDYEPKTDKEIVINLSYALSDTSVANLDNAFIVENSENLRVSGLKATASDDKKAIKLQLKDLDITGGVYKITSKAGVIYNVSGEELPGILITVDTGSDAAFGNPVGEGAGSGAPLAPEADFSTVVLLDENFENSIEKAEKGIEFTPSVNWYTSPEKIPLGFTVKKEGLEYRDAKIAVVPDPADPSSGNMVLVNDTGYYAKDGSVAAGALDKSNAPNYTIVSRAMDKTITIPKNKYTQVRMSSKIYVPAKSMNYLPLSSQQLRNSEYVIAGTSNSNKTINTANFAKTTDGLPKFTMYNGNATDTSTGATGSFDLTFTPNEWHTMEYVFSMYEYVADSGAWKGGFQVYIDGVAVKDGIAFLSNDYETINGMMSRIVAASTGGSVVVYYDDWKITYETKYTTHVDTPQTNVPENQDIKLTLTKALDAESVKLINDSIANDNLEDIVTVKDAEGNVVKANIAITNGDVITIDPVNGLKYNTEYIIEVKPTTKVNGIEYRLKAADGEEYKGVSYPFTTAKAKDTYIDAETSAATFNCYSTTMETATRFTYNMTLSGAHPTDVIAAVAAFTEKEELIGSQYQVITSGNTQAAFDFNTFAGKTGAKTVRMYIWEAKPDGNGGYKMGRLMQLPDEITSR